MVQQVATVAAAEALAIAAVTRNADWTPVEADFGGSTMVLVPAGCFDMGSDTNDDEKPLHEQCFDAPFWIDKTEVTQAQFRELGGSKANANLYSGDNRPVEQITWFEADEYCQQHGGRLPTEAEWEYAARGPEGWVYPWGDTFAGDNVVYSSNSGGQTASVGSRPAGASWVGAQDMSGNVWEWTSSLYSPYPYNASDGREADTGNSTNVRRVLRGGSWYSNADILRAAIRNWNSPVNGSFFDGFRCVRDFESKPDEVIIENTPQPLPTSTPEAVELGFTPVTRNADWSPLERDFGGVPMMLVPAGCFNMGSDNGFDDEKPVHQICFDAPFWIDKTEVTQAQFRAKNGIQAQSSRFSGDNHPVERITWFEADEYCQQRGARLPTEAEWEYAARGPESWEYPWGDTFVGDNVVHFRNSGGQTTSVGSRPAGASWVGAQDLSGNVWEWTSSLYHPYPYNASDGREADTGNSTNVTRVLRGGSWDYGSGLLRAAYRYGVNPGFWNFNFGFRCARSS